jgi:hypothetical protein
LLPKEQTYLILTDAATYGTVPKIVFVMMMGLLYDTFGRKFNMFLLTLMTAICTILIPLVAPNS